MFCFYVFYVCVFFSYHMSSCRLEDKDVNQQVDSPRWVSSSQNIINLDYSSIHWESQIGEANRNRNKKIK